MGAAADLLSIYGDAKQLLRSILGKLSYCIRSEL